VRCPFCQLLRITSLPLMCAACFSLAGGHWMALQMVAWAQMLRDYSKNVPIAEAVQKTFGGAAPCTMCKMIANGQQKEEKAPASTKLDKRTEVLPFSARDQLWKPECKDFSYPPLGEAIFAKRFEAPPFPVPIPA
jgi:hypothetical protein